MKLKSKNIVLASGTFDILHVGHLNYLEYAKSFGDYLIVHIESDEAVKRHKGKDRPINSEKDRQRIINSLGIITGSFIADGEKESDKILEKYRPAVFILAKKDHFDIKKLENQFRKVLPGLKIIWFNKESSLSSSRIIKKIKSL